MLEIFTSHAVFSSLSPPIQVLIVVGVFLILHTLAQAFGRRT